jgi:hypothetical protein
MARSSAAPLAPVAVGLLALLLATVGRALVTGAQDEVAPALVAPYAQPRPCHASPGVAFLVSPRTAGVRDVARVLAVSEQGFEGVLSVEDAKGTPVGRSDERHGATPYSWLATVVLHGDPPFRARLTRTDAARTPGADDPNGHDACATLGASDDTPVRVSGGAWPVARAWDRETEMLYSAWIEHLFDDPLEAEPSWHGLDPILTDPERNLLYDYLDLGEDEPGLGLEPDCADLPYFLRAYFAWKLALPFGYSTCSRGGGPPRCSAWRSKQETLTGASSDPGARFCGFVRGQVA